MSTTEEPKESVVKEDTVESPNKESVLSDSDNWVKEAEAVIRDVREHLNDIRVHSTSCSSSSCIYFSVQTLESLTLTVRLSTEGFSVVDEGKDEVEENEEDNTEYFETPYALFSSISEGFVASFASCLTQKLDCLNDSHTKEKKQS